MHRVFVGCSHGVRSLREKDPSNTGKVDICRKVFSVKNLPAPDPPLQYWLIDYAELKRSYARTEAILKPVPCI